MHPHQLLEQELAGWQTGLGRPTDPSQVVVCSSGTAALHLALETLTAGLSDEERRRSVVVIPDYTMVSVARAVVLAGMRPVFCDVLPDGPYFGNLDPAGLTAASVGQFSSGCQIRAVISVATCGRVVHPDMFRLCEMGRWSVIEDLAEAHGLLPNPQSYAACWSFYRNKIVAGEEGGAVWYSGDYPGYGGPYAKYIANKARSLRCIGFTPAHDYTHVPRGHNYRLADLLAEPIRDSLRRFKENQLARCEMACLYATVIGPALARAYHPDGAVLWVYDVRVPGMTAETQTRLVRSLQEAGVAARFGFKPLSGQAEFGGKPTCPVSARLSTEVIHLPLFGALTPTWRTREVVETAARVFRSVLG